MNLKKTFKNNQGFSLIELLISSTATLIIMGSIFTLLIAFSQKSGDDQSRVRQLQESRFVLNILSSNLKNAGSVLSIGQSMLHDVPYFTGIYPLNNTDSPDGIIIAAGDPDAVTTLSAAFSSADSSISVADTNINTGGLQWSKGDYGIILSNNGYYVFTVESDPGTGATSINIRKEAVYYSGLLNTDDYIDDNEGASKKGNAITYPFEAPVIRLANFSIYLIKEESDGSSATGGKRRNLVRVVDAFGIVDVLNSSSKSVKKYIMAENIWDLQIAYNAYPDAKVNDFSTKIKYFMPQGSSTTLANLILEFKNKTVREIQLNIVVLSDKFVSNKKRFGNYKIPVLGDRASYSMPKGKYDYKIYKMLIEPKNFGINL